MIHCSCILFQFTHPRGVRLLFRTLKHFFSFQFTHLHGGATLIYEYSAPFGRVSIHAPTCGVRQHMVLKKLNVSTHAPTWGGSATNATINSDGSTWFQLTHPRGGATRCSGSGSWGTVFQFTHPRGGATKFQFTHPRGVRQIGKITRQFQFTHPRRGTIQRRLLCSPCPCFNSRTHVGGATCQVAPFHLS